MRNTMFPRERPDMDREQREEQMLKPHYFPKWLADAGFPDHVIAALTAVSDEPPVDGRSLRATGRTELFAFRCRLDIRERCKEVAMECGVSIAEWMEDAIRTAIQKHDNKSGRK